MKYIFFILFLLSIPLSGFCQCIHLSDSSISHFNAIIDSLENVYEKTKGKSLESLPQSVGHYFWLETDQADDFILALENNTPIDSLVSQFPDLILTKDLLLVRHTIPILINGKQRTSIHGLPSKHFDSYELILDSVRVNKQEDAEIYWHLFKSYDGTTKMYGFWVLEKFRTWQIPVTYSDWAHYHDVVTMADDKLFLAQSKNPTRITEYLPSIIDTLVDYYHEKSMIPQYEYYMNDKGGWVGFNARHKDFVRISDSLYSSDSNFKSLLEKSFEFSLKENKDNDYLLAWVARYYPDENVLLQMRKNQMLISHYPDMKPIFQKQKMAEYALKTQQWPTFVKSMIGVGEYSIADTCHNYIPGALENYYIRKLLQLDLDIPRLILAMLLRKKFSFGFNILGAEYYSTIQLVRFIDNKSQEEFEKAIVHIIKDENVDPIINTIFIMLIASTFQVISLIQGTDIQHS